MRAKSYVPKQRPKQWDTWCLVMLSLIEQFMIDFTDKNKVMPTPNVLKNLFHRVAYVSSAKYRINYNSKQMKVRED